jgi:sporulation-control protein
MSKLLSSVGIGSAEVDTILPTDRVVPGQSLDARVEIEGGSSEQDVEQIYFALATKYQTEEGYSSGTIDKFKLAEDFTISSGEKRTEAVTIDIPYRTPLTKGRTDVWIKTGLDIDWAIDPKDKDRIQVEPDDRLTALQHALKRLGFSFHSADVMSSSRGAFTTRSFVQELEYKPTSGEFHGRLDEIEIVPIPSANETEVVVEVDKRGGLFEEMADWDEGKTSMTFDHADVDRLEEELRQTIERKA